MMTILTNAAFFKAKPGQRDTLGARLLKLVAPTRQEAGCLTRSRHDRSNRPRGQGCLAPNLAKFSVTYMACSVDLKAIEHVARPGKTGVIV
jgi:hypothetical protein